MKEAEVEAEKTPLPLPIGKAVLAVVASSTYSSIAGASISEPREAFIFILAGVFSFFAVFGRNSKQKALLATIASGSVWAFPAGPCRAAVSGFFTAYLQTLSEIYVSNLALSAFRPSAVEFVNIATSMQTLLIYFFLLFLSLGKISGSFALMALLVSGQALAVFFFAPTPPIELVSSASASDSLIYGEVYRKLTGLLDKAPFSHFHEEYSEIVDLRNGKSSSVKTKLWVIAEKINFSFFSVAFFGMLSVDRRGFAAYLVVFTCSTMFSWIYAYRSRKHSLEMCALAIFAVLLILLVAKSATSFWIFAIGCSIYLVPTEETLRSQTPLIIAHSNSQRALLAAATFFVLKRGSIY